MKAEDIMLRDWVQCERGIGKVIHIGILFIVILVDGKEVLKKADEVQPIELTTEILETNGFENDFYEDESVADYVKVRNEGYSLHSTAHEWDAALITWCNGHVNVVTDFSGEYRGEIEYVHELQHALRLCGIDKEIVV